MRKVLLFIFFSTLSQNSFPADYINGFKGLWYTLGQYGTYGDKYSGGLGTYTAKHLPLAIYSPEAQKTFFTYGGTTSYTENQLLIMISYYDHVTEQLAKPMILFNKEGVIDAHDNGTIQIDDDGYIWVFIAGRYRERNGYIFKSDQPYSINSFSEVLNKPLNYPQPKYLPEKGFVLLFTNMGSGRELYVQSSPDGHTWSSEKKLVGFRGHYQASANTSSKVGFVYNWHKNGNVDNRTNLYYMQSTDMGKTWTTINNEVLTTPLTTSSNPSLIKDYESLNLKVYLKDIDYDKNGYPVVLYITSPSHLSGPTNPTREWRLARWDGTQWLFTFVTYASHNYDMGSLYLEDGTYRIVAPTEVGPQQWGTGGEIAIWESYDEGANWVKTVDVTSNSNRNHTYARRPFNVNDDFYTMWADGNTNTLSRSYLYYTNKEGKAFQMPYDTNDDMCYGIPLDETIEIYPQIVDAPAIQQGYPAIKIVDGQIGETSMWKSQYFPKSIIIDYGEELKLNQAKLHPESGRSYSYNLELSTEIDFSNKTVINYTASNIPQNTNNLEFEPTIARYARLTITGQYQNQDNNININEFELLLNNNDIPSTLRNLNQDLNIFPNPSTNGYFKIEGLHRNASIEIFTVNGVSIYKSLATANSATINTQSFPKGIVLVKIMDANTKSVFKVIIK